MVSVLIRKVFAASVADSIIDSIGGPPCYNVSERTVIFMDLLSPSEYRMLRKVKRSIFSPLLLDRLNTFDRDICVSLCEKGFLKELGLNCVDLTEKGAAILRERTLKILPIFASCFAVVISIVSLVLSIAL